MVLDFYDNIAAEYGKDFADRADNAAWDTATDYTDILMDKNFYGKPRRSLSVFSATMENMYIPEKTISGDYLIFFLENMELLMVKPIGSVRRYTKIG